MIQLPQTIHMTIRITSIKHICLQCCPDVYLCDQERECASKEQFCEPEVQTLLYKAPRFSIRRVIGLSFPVLEATHIDAQHHIATVGPVVIDVQVFFLSQSQSSTQFVILQENFPVLPEWRSCPCTRGRLLPFQRLLPVATLPGHILSSKGIIIFIFLFLVLQKHHFSECLNHPKNEQKCPTGDIAPIPRDSCCPSKAECDNKNCSQVIERTSYFSFFQAIFPAPAVFFNVCFRPGALYCRTVR